MSLHSKCAFAALLALVACHSHAGTPDATFQGIGFLQGGNQSSVESISRTGTYLVGSGRCTPGPDNLSYNGIIWSKNGGLTRISNTVSLSAISDDGSVAAGEGRWWSAITGVHTFPETDVHAFGVSSDGSIFSGYFTSGGYSKPARWTEPTGWQPIADFGSKLSVGSVLLSSQGDVFAGYTYFDGGSPFRWTQSGGATLLPDLGYGYYTGANGLSGDGNILVGSAQSAVSKSEAVRWRTFDGIQSLGSVGLQSATANGTSGDGAVIVGMLSDHTLSPSTGSFVWFSKDGMHDLQQYLNDHGANTTGWSNLTATCVSEDGTKIGGSGIDPTGKRQGFYATITPPAFVDQPTVTALEVLPSSRVGGNQVTMRATISSPAPAEGAKVYVSSLSSNLIPKKTGLLNNQAGFFFPEGSTVAYEVASTRGIATNEVEHVKATYGFLSKYAVLPLEPADAYIPTLSSTSVTGGATVQMTVRLNGQAPSSGGTCSISSSDPNAASAPASATFDANAYSKAVTVTTHEVFASEDVVLTVTYRNKKRLVTLRVNPSPSPSVVAFSWPGAKGGYFVTPGFDAVAGTYFRITGNTNVVVTALGHEFEHEGKPPEPVGIFDGVTGALMVSATIGVGDPLVNGYYWKSVTPTTLLAGHTYHSGALHHAGSGNEYTKGVNAPSLPAFIQDLGNSYKRTSTIGGGTWQFDPPETPRHFVANFRVEPAH